MHVGKRQSLSGVIGWTAVVLVALGSVSRAGAQPKDLGIFEAQTDIGNVHPAGTAAQVSDQTYRLSSSGANLWMGHDDFHLLWKKVEGDVSLTAEIQFAPARADSNPHRKAVLIFRQSLEPDSVYADVALHGSGETALQYRHAAGDTTQEISFTQEAPRRIRLEKRGDTITVFASAGDEPLHQVGASVPLHLEGSFYAGLGLCAHNPEAVETATFSHVTLQKLNSPSTKSQKALYSSLQTIAIDHNARNAYVAQTAKGQLEAPNWSRDGKMLVYNTAGKIWTVPVQGGTAKSIDIGAAGDCTGSHGLSPDGALLAVTCTTPEHPGRRVYVVAAGGGQPHMLTQNPDSYFHSWSPDGKTIAFTRPNHHGGGNIFTIPAAGGEETALTQGDGISDDPDYSADGQYIYFNSDRAGGMQIWRMKADGSHPEQVTFDEKRNWTPHPSPDGKSILILSYDKDVTGHPANKLVTLRILDVASRKVRDLVQIVGGAGSDNVPNWAPDGQHFAFVSFQWLPESETGSTE